MGLFQFPFKHNKPAPSSPAPTPTPTPAPAQTQPERKVTVQSETVRPQPQPQQAPAKPAEPPKQEIVRYLFTMSTPDKAKLTLFFVTLSRKCLNEWRTIQARVAMHTDKKKVRIEVKGTHEEHEKFVAWCKLDHYGTHAIFVEKYTGFTSMLPLGETCADIKNESRVKNIFK